MSKKYTTDGEGNPMGPVNVQAMTDQVAGYDAQIAGIDGVIGDAQASADQAAATIEEKNAEKAAVAAQRQAVVDDMSSIQKTEGISAEVVDTIITAVPELAP